MKTRRSKRRMRKQMGGQIEALTVQFGNKIITGGFIQKSATQIQPTVVWAAPPKDSYYTLLCFDPNATTKPSWLHWMVVNCVGTGPMSGEARSEWTPPAPPRGTGVHLYIFTLFSHVHPIPDDITPIERGYFDPTKYAAKYVLKPVATTSMKVRAE